ncbi:hypothetical protein Bbelb_007610 [Branchiostoma belcheri]|nr:hypothetical protein Bbelb_007610 [Branchiostoma belcheri]
MWDSLGRELTFGAGLHESGHAGECDAWVGTSPDTCRPNHHDASQKACRSSFRECRQDLGEKTKLIRDLSGELDDLRLRLMEAEATGAKRRRSAGTPPSETKINNMPTGTLARAEAWEMRLNGGLAPNRGRVELRPKGGNWGVICDDNWDKKAADIVCRMMGFANGSKMEAKWSRFGDGRKDFLMDDVNCTGNENTLMECLHSDWGKHDCDRQEVAGVVCLPKEGRLSPCDWGKHDCDRQEVAGVVCLAKEVSYQRELEECFSGRGESYRGRASRTLSGQSCLMWSEMVGTKYNTLRYPQGEFGLGQHNYCRNPDGDLRPWCYVGDPKQPGYDYCDIHECDVDCYSGDGSRYRGAHSKDARGRPCLAWDAEETLGLEVNVFTHPNGKAGIGPHHFCRNPGGGQAPWCYVREGRVQRRECGVPRCEHPPAHGHAARAFGPQCKQNEIRCRGDNRNTICLPEEFRCDGDRDCADGEDEANCDNFFNEYRVTRQSGLKVPLYEVGYMNVDVERCMQICSETTDFICRSFDYHRASRSCDLVSKPVQVVGGLVSSGKPSVDHYERIHQPDMDCEKLPNGPYHRCPQGRCIHQLSLCNNVNDCGDFSDEENCDSDVPFEVRVRGGETEGQGRVEVKYRGEWGLVCDDKWDIKDAGVVCREMGYTLGAEEAYYRSSYGAGSQPFVLDDLECVGTESSLQECAHAPWGQHDCSRGEAAAVKCKLRQGEHAQYGCRENEHECINRKCIPSSFLCDGQNDCEDWSDEAQCNCYRGKGLVYRGNDHETISGLTCLFWNETLDRKFNTRDYPNGQLGLVIEVNVLDQSALTMVTGAVADTVVLGHYVASGPHNFCRNPDGDEKPWCYTVSDKHGTWSYCAIPKCTSPPREPPKYCRNDEVICANRACLPARFLCDGKDECGDGSDETFCDCFRGRGKDYRGRHSVTTDGLPCLFWNETTHLEFNSWKNSQTEYGIGQHNYCRNPDGDRAPWCYTHPNGRYGYCNVSRCQDKFDMSDRPVGDAPRSTQIRRPRPVIPCGTPSVSPLLSGDVAVKGEHPWQALLLTKGVNHVCSGTLVHDCWVVTAAHCMDRSKDAYVIRLGEYNNVLDEKTEQDFRIDTAVIHPGYDVVTGQHDIALLKLRKKNGECARLTNYVRPICLPETEMTFPVGTLCDVSGWGRTDTDRSVRPTTLTKARVPLLQDALCGYIYGDKLLPGMQCAGHVRGGNNACKGDIGGPLSCKHDGKWVLWGVTSWGFGCGEPKTPGVFTRVTEYSDWLQRVMAFY